MRRMALEMRSLGWVDCRRPGKPGYSISGVVRCASRSAGKALAAAGPSKPRQAAALARTQGSESTSRRTRRAIWSSLKARGRFPSGEAQYSTRSLVSRRRSARSFVDSTASRLRSTRELVRSDSPPHAYPAISTTSQKTMGTCTRRPESKRCPRRFTRRGAIAARRLPAGRRSETAQAGWRGFSGGLLTPKKRQCDLPPSVVPIDSSEPWLKVTGSLC